MKATTRRHRALVSIAKLLPGSGQGNNIFVLIQGTRQMKFKPLRAKSEGFLKGGNIL